MMTANIWSGYPSWNIKDRFSIFDLGDFCPTRNIMGCFLPKLFCCAHLHFADGRLFLFMWAFAIQRSLS